MVKTLIRSLTIPHESITGLGQAVQLNCRMEMDKHGALEVAVHILYLFLLINEN